MRSRVGRTSRIGVVSLVWMLAVGAVAVWAECECGYDSCPTETCSESQCQEQACDCSDSCDCAGTRCSSADPPCAGVTKDCWETGCQPTYTASCTCKLCIDYSTEESDLPCYALPPGQGITGTPRDCSEQPSIKGCDGFDCACEDTYCPAGGIFPCEVRWDGGPCLCGYCKGNGYEKCQGQWWDCWATEGLPCDESQAACTPGASGCTVLGGSCTNPQFCGEGECCLRSCTRACPSMCGGNYCGYTGPGTTCGSCGCSP